MLSPPDYATSTGFATGISSLVDIQVHPDGSLYYLARGGGEVFRVQFTANTAPSISSQPANVTVAAGQSASFSVAASGTAPLGYQWQRNGVNIAGATSPTYSLHDDCRRQRRDVPRRGQQRRRLRHQQLGDADGADQQRARRARSPRPRTARRTAAGRPSRSRARAPTRRMAPCRASAFTWRVDFHHDDHTHPHVAPTSGITTGTFTIANRGETSANVFYRVHLTVRDSVGSHAHLVRRRAAADVSRAHREQRGRTHSSRSMARRSPRRSRSPASKASSARWAS